MKLRVGSLVAALLALPAAALAGPPTEAVKPFYAHPGLELEASARDRFVDPAFTILNQNDTIKMISAVFGIIAVPTFIASVYGMNFDNMPELHWHYGYAYALALMGVCVVALASFFRRIDWI